MTPKFRENAAAQRCATSIFHLVTDLSMAGFRVIKFTGGEQASIQIDMPFDGEEIKFTDHGDKQFGSCRHKGVRLFWEVPAVSPESEVTA
jgi:hypothetical protein